MKDSLDVIFALAEGHGLPPKIVAELLAATRRYIEDEKQRARVEEIERIKRAGVFDPDGGGIFTYGGAYIVAVRIFDHK